MSEQFLLGSVIAWPVAAAIISYLIGRKEKKLRDKTVAAATALELILTCLLMYISQKNGGIFLEIPEICGMGMTFQTDGFRVLYGVIAAFMWLTTAIVSPEYFAKERNRNRYYLFFLLTLGATEAIFFSGDLFTTFLFFEIMSFASYVWVAQEEKKEALRFGATYLAIAVIGGMVMLMGLFLLYQQTQTLVIDELYQACQGKDVRIAAVCMFVGFGAKAGAFPLHIWLPKAHPVAPAPASALLSGILTKTGIFGILILSCQIMRYDGVWGTFVLVIGVFTMVIGAILALFSVNFKRTLACSSVSQIGFILVAVGMMGLSGEGNSLAAQGTIGHMVNHSLFKLVLFLVAGVIFMNTHKLNLNEIRGFGRKKPWLAGVYLCAALGIGGIPVFSGYVSKTLIHESIVEYIHEIQHGAAVTAFGVSDMKIIEWLFLISGGMTVAYMCKLFVAVFVEKNDDAAVQAAYDQKKIYVSFAGKVMLTISAALFVIMGAAPQLTMEKMANAAQSFLGVASKGETIAYFSWTNLKGGLISIGIGVVIYLVFVRGVLMKKQENGQKVYIDCWPKVLDLEDTLYRPILLGALPIVCGVICRIFDQMVDWIIRLLERTIYREAATDYELEEGNGLTHCVGSVLNETADLLNHTVWKQHPNEKDYVHGLALVYSNIKENMGIIGRSLSYGLLLFCLGLCGTLIYLLVTAFI